MKRSIILALCFLLLIACATGCRSEKDSHSSTYSTTSATNNPTHSLQIDGDKALSCTKGQDSLQIKVTLPQCAEKEVALILLTSPEYQYNWEEDPASRLIDMSQLKLDKNGEGSTALKLSTEIQKCYLCLTAPAGSCIVEVK